MEYQALMVVRALELALAKAQDLLQAVPLGQPQSEAQVQLLVQALVQVQRQALALEQVLQVQEVPLQQQVVPQAMGEEVFPQPLEAGQELQLGQVPQLAQGLVQALVEAEEQVEVLAAGQVWELVEVPLLEMKEEKE
jgi:hypothetical protein